MSKFRLCLDGLTTILNSELGFEVVATGAPSPATVATLLAMELDAILVDVGSSEGIAVVEILANSHAEVPIVAIAVADRPEQVRVCAHPNVVGFVPDFGSPEDLIAVLQGMRDGRFVCSSRSATLLFQHFKRMARSEGTLTPIDALTLRERQVLELLDQGMSNKEIARALAISVATVKNHVHSILEKLRVSSRAQAVHRLHHAG